MKTATLYRFAEHKGATLGVLRTMADEWFTLEEGWRLNAKSISCIPVGTYVCEIVNSPSKGRVYQVKNVPNRSNILIHSGNTTGDTEGCILLGHAVKMDKDQSLVMESRAAVDDFMQSMNGESFMLEIRSVA